jgi:hypothetical protein
MEKISLIHTKQRERLEQKTTPEGSVGEKKEKNEEMNARMEKKNELKYEIERNSYISAMVNWADSGWKTKFEWLEKDKEYNNFTYSQFLGEYGLGLFGNMEKWELSTMYWILHKMIDWSKQKSETTQNPELFISMRKWVCAAIWNISNSRTKADKDLMFGVLPWDPTSTKDQLYNTWLKSDKKYLIALFWRALIYSPDMNDCPIPDLQDLCKNKNILNAYLQSSEWLHSLWASSDLIWAVDDGGTKSVDAKREGGSIVKSLHEYLSNESLKSRYGIKVQVAYPDKRADNFGYITISDYKGNSLWNPIEQKTQFDSLINRSMFEPLRRKSDAMLEYRSKNLLNSYHNDESIISTKKSETWTIRSFLDSNKQQFTFMEMFQFLNKTKDKPKWYDPKFYILSWLQENPQLARDHIYKYFAPLYTEYLKGQYESVKLSSQVSMQLGLVDNQLNFIHDELNKNREVDRAWDKVVQYPDESLRKNLDNSFVLIQNCVHDINELSLTPKSIIDKELITRYGKTMAKIFLAMSWLDPNMMVGDMQKMNKEMPNIYSAIMKNGGRPYANQFMNYFEEYVNTLDETQLFELANGFFMVSFMTGNDEYDPMEKMMLSNVAPIIYNKISDNLIEQYAKKKHEWEATPDWAAKNTLKLGLEWYYDAIVQFYRIISGRKDTQFAMNKFNKEEWYSYDLGKISDLLTLPAWWPAIKYFTNLYDQADRIGNLRDDSLLWTPVAIAGLEKLFRISGKYDNMFEPQISAVNGVTTEDYSRRVSTLRDYKIPNDDKNEAIRNKKFSDIGMELNDIENINTLPRWDEHFHNKLMELWFMNLAMDHFKPEGYTISSLVDKAKDHSQDKSIQCMKFYNSLTQAQLTELCCLRSLCKQSTDLSGYLANANVYGAEFLDKEKDKTLITNISWLKSGIDNFQSAFSALMKGAMIQWFAKDSNSINTINDAWVSLYYNIIWDNSVDVNRHSVVFGNASDESIRKQRWYTKTVAIIAGWIAVWLLTFGVGAGVMGTVVWLKAVGLALAIGTTTTAYGYATRQEWYVNPDNIYADLGSQFFVNSATALIGIKYFNPGMGNLVGIQNPAYSTALKYALADGTSGFGGEILRQKALASCTEIKSMDLNKALTMWGFTLLMSLISPAVSRLAQKRMQWVEIDPAEMQAAKEWINLVDPNKKTQIINEMKTTLVRNGVPKDKAEKTANRMRDDREKAKNKLKELEGWTFVAKDKDTHVFDFSSIDSPAKAKDFVKSLTESEDGIALLRLFMDSEITEDIWRYTLRQQVASASPNERSEIGLILLKAMWWTESWWSSGWKNALQKAHEVWWPLSPSKPNYTEDEVAKKITILREAVKNWHITRDAMKAWLRLNVCGGWKQIGYHFEDMIIIASGSDFPKCLSRNGTFVDGIGGDVVKKWCFLTDCKVWDANPSSLANKDITLTEIIRNTDKPWKFETFSIGWDKHSVKFTDGDGIEHKFVDKRWKMTKEEAEEVVRFFTRSWKESTESMIKVTCNFGPKAKPSYLIPKSYLKVKRNTSGKNYCYISQLEPSLKGQKFNGAKDIHEFKPQFDTWYENTARPFYELKTKLEWNDRYIGEVESVFDGTAKSITALEASRGSRLWAGSKVDIELVPNNGKPYVKVSVNKFNNPNGNLPTGNLYYHRFIVD